MTQDVVAKGTLAATELITAVRRRRAGEPERARHHLLPAELVVREELGAPAPVSELAAHHQAQQRSGCG